MGGQAATKASTNTSAEGTRQRSQLHASQYVPSGPHADVLAWQRTAGNRAVTKLLEAEDGNSPPTGDGLEDRQTPINKRLRPLPSANASAVNAKCACGNHTMAGGECEECSKKKRVGLQTKLKVNEPGDSDEREADRVAEQVMAMPAGLAISGAPPRIQRFSGQSNGQADAAPASVDQALARPGRPLEPALRQDMEQRFGYDFSRVRVHSGAAAEQSAQEVNANAYTMGNAIVFGAGWFAPGTHQGRRLIAHELTHVVQQQSVIPRHDALADGNTAAEVEAARVATAAHGDDVAVIGERAGAIQLKRDGDVKLTQPTPIKRRPGNTERIEDAYGAGSLDESQWRNLFDSAEQAIAKRQMDEASRLYLTLYADIAKLAQATRVVSSSGGINVVTGSKNNCKNARPGLNLSLGSRDDWDANATTAYVDDQGKFGVKLNPRGAPQPEVAIVLSRSAFKREKEQTLAALRHEMVHAEYYMEDAAKALLSDPKDKSGPDMTSAANTELLAYVEGFMTMFHLSQPAPRSLDHPAFVELLGALDVGGRQTLPWAEAAPPVRSEALGRLQEYYCHALDGPHREAFDAWVGYKLTEVRRDEVITTVFAKGGESSPEAFSPGSFDEKALELMQRRGGDVWGAVLRVQTLQGDFFRGLQRVIASKCQGPTIPMKL
jgi:hypothetical protein